jgi:hypothetical protein
VAHIVRDGEIVAIPIQLNQRVKIGCYYQPPQLNYLDRDQLWIQDVYVFKQIPWYMIKNRFERYLLYAALYGAIVVMLTMIGRHWLGAPH